jgi:hypothetical protein
MASDHDLLTAARAVMPWRAERDRLAARIAMMEYLGDWPVYVRDDGVITCSQPGCEEEGWDWSEIGRRTNVRAFFEALVLHARQQHGIKLEGGTVD